MVAESLALTDDTSNARRGGGATCADATPIEIVNEAMIVRMEIFGLVKLLSGPDFLQPCLNHFLDESGRGRLIRGEADGAFRHLEPLKFVSELLNYSGSRE